jgi:small subunit ribosomal protein S16
MAVRIRFARHGKKKAPFYRLVVTDSRSPRDGRYIEMIGTYDPLTEPSAIKVDEERALHWLRQGAQPSDTAISALRKAGIWEKFQAEKNPPKAEAPAL